MANNPAQLPNIDLPGAEFFSLSQNRTISLQGRRRGFAQLGAPVNVPGGSQGQAALLIQLETGFFQSAGIYIHEMSLAFVPSDQTGELQIGGTGFGLGINPTPGPTDFSLMLGIPNGTYLAPTTTQLIVEVRDQLVAWRDIATSTAGTPMGVGSPNNVLNLSSVVVVRNADTVNHLFSIAMRWIYSRLDGIVE